MKTIGETLSSQKKQCFFYKKEFFDKKSANDLVVVHSRLFA